MKSKTFQPAAEEVRRAAPVGERAGSAISTVKTPRKTSFSVWSSVAVVVLDRVVGLEPDHDGVQQDHRQHAVLEPGGLRDAGAETRQASLVLRSSARASLDRSHQARSMTPGAFPPATGRVPGSSVVPASAPDRLPCSYVERHAGCRDPVRPDSRGGLVGFQDQPRRRARRDRRCRIAWTRSRARWHVRSSPSSGASCAGTTVGTVTHLAGLGGNFLLPAVAGAARFA